MTQSAPDHSLPLHPIGDCWKTVGVLGDRSCGLLQEHIHCRNCPVFAAAGRAFFNREAPEGYETEWTSRLKLPEEHEPTYIGTGLVFRVGTHWLAVEVDLVAEVAATRPITRIPHRSNPILLGLVNIRGELQLCASLHGLFNVPIPPDSLNSALAPRRMLVLHRNRAQWVVPVDEVAGIRRFASSQVRPMPDEVTQITAGIARELIQLNGMPTGRLDCDKLWTALEGSIA